VRIGIVNDLPLAVEALRRALAVAPQHRVAWVARDGAEAVALCKQDTPDLVLMDLLMPGMGGVEATRRIMAATPCAILVVTVNVGTNAALVFEAMGYGALDAIDTPPLGAGDPVAAAAPLLTKIHTIETLLGDRNGAPVADGARAASTPARAPKGLVAMGASAGGPAAILAVLRGLPKDFPAAVVVVQHVDQRFAVGMADWLHQQSPLPVRLAQEGDRPAARAVLLAGTDDHLVLKDSNRLGYTPEPRNYVYRPSVDVFLDSVSDRWQGEAVGVLLTGMGRDGARGLKAVRDKGHYTIAQDRVSSTVYGMPKAAAELDAAVDVLPLDRIAAKLASLFPTSLHGEDHG
jgi:two-component system, chemotaxis family, response regulator WspF